MDYRGLLGLVGFLILFKFLVDKFWKRRSAYPPFPPGPPPHFLVGNYREIPTKLPWLTYTEWGRRYGDLVHASALGQHIVSVNSLKTAYELFEKRSHIYSDRDFNIGLLGYGNKWRRERRMFQQHFRRDISRAYQPIQTKNAHRFLRGLMTSPGEFRELIKTLTAAVIMSTVYGYEIEPIKDRFVALSENAVKKLADSFLPGAAIANTFPSLRYLPGWVPGCGFQYLAAECRVVLDEMKHAPFEFVKKHMSEDVVSKSVVGKLLDASEARGHPVELIQDALSVTTVVYGTHECCNLTAGADTVTRSTDITGTHRLPEFEDRTLLPFVEALYREVLRWRPVLPLAEDDVYKGYFIPKGTGDYSAGTDAITTSSGTTGIRAMTRDESVYPDPERFNPDRFFTAEGSLNEDDVGIGIRVRLSLIPNLYFGRRAIVSVSATMNISKAKDAAGKDIETHVVYSDGNISHPGPFPCLITPRSESAKYLVNATALHEL
ncbi:cytochrome P450 [Mycena filopes]|nr:cytochrome P450 [Mycena filopes]